MSEDSRPEMLSFYATSGRPEDRPPGFPCFHCGVQVTEERCVKVTWQETGQITYEPWCGNHDDAGWFRLDTSRQIRNEDGTATVPLDIIDSDSNPMFGRARLVTRASWADWRAADG